MSEAELIDHLAALGLRTTEHGRLYQRGVRETVGALLSPRSLAGSETCVAMHALADALADFGRRLYAGSALDEAISPLRPLRESRAGIPLDDLLDHLTAVFDRDDAMAFLAESERGGVLIRWREGEEGAGDDDGGTDADDGETDGGSGNRRRVLVGLSEQGHQVFDAYLRRLADAHATLLADITPDQLATIRHVCLTVLADADSRLGSDDRDDVERDGRPVPRRYAPRLELENGRFYDGARREFIGSLEPERIRALETMHSLATVALRAPRLPLPAQRQALPLWWLYQQPAGISRGPIADTIGRDGARTLDELVRAGILTRTPDSTGADTNVLRLGDKGDQMMAALVRGISRDMAEMFDGIGLDDLELTRDGCWRIVLNARRVAG